MTLNEISIPSNEFDFYNIVKNLNPGRCPSIYHNEQEFLWREMPTPPVFKVYNTSFYKITPKSASIDLRTHGQIHYWTRTNNPFCPALVIFYINNANNVECVRYYFYNGLMVDDKINKKMTKIISPDNELFRYCLAAFIRQYISISYSFS